MACIHDAIDSKRTMFTVIIALIRYAFWYVECWLSAFIAIGQEVGFLLNLLWIFSGSAYIIGFYIVVWALKLLLLK